MKSNQLKAEIAQYYKETDWDTFMCSSNAYKFGESRTFTQSGFNFGKAAEKFKMTELTPATFAQRFTDKKDKTLDRQGSFRLDTYGISIKNFYAIARDNKMWRYTIFHEAGHIIYGHGQASLENLAMAMFDPNYRAKAELQADMFAFFCLKELGMDLEQYGRLIAFKFNDIPERLEIPEDVIETAQKLAKDFIAAGK